jgi:hypothetical protein
VQGFFNFVAYGLNRTVRGTLDAAILQKCCGRGLCGQNRHNAGPYVEMETEPASPSAIQMGETVLATSAAGRDKYNANDTPFHDADADDDTLEEV